MEGEDHQSSLPIPPRDGTVARSNSPSMLPGPWNSDAAQSRGVSPPQGHVSAGGIGYHSHTGLKGDMLGLPVHSRVAVSAVPVAPMTRAAHIKYILNKLADAQKSFKHSTETHVAHVGVLFNNLREVMTPTETNPDLTAAEQAEVAHRLDNLASSMHSSRLSPSNTSDRNEELQAMQQKLDEVAARTQDLNERMNVAHQGLGHLRTLSQAVARHLDIAEAAAHHAQRICARVDASARIHTNHEGRIHEIEEMIVLVSRVLANMPDAPTNNSTAGGDHVGGT